MALFTSDKNSEKVQKTEAVLEDAAKAQEEKQATTGKVRAQSYWQVSWNIFKRNKLGMICLGIVLALAIIAILAPVIAPYSYKDQNLAIMNQNPTFAHLLGTDEYGRDILSRIIYGCQISLSVGIISQAIALFIGYLFNLYYCQMAGKKYKSVRIREDKIATAYCRKVQSAIRL